jgi:hypothetical protein
VTDFVSALASLPMILIFAEEVFGGLFLMLWHAQGERKVSFCIDAMDGLAYILNEIDKFIGNDLRAFLSLSLF